MDDNYAKIEEIIKKLDQDQLEKVKDLLELLFEE